MNWLKELLEFNNITAYKLGKECGIAGSQLSAIINRDTDKFNVKYGHVTKIHSVIEGMNGEWDFFYCKEVFKLSNHNLSYTKKVMEIPSSSEGYIPVDVNGVIVRLTREYGDFGNEFYYSYNTYMHRPSLKGVELTIGNSYADAIYDNSIIINKAIEEFLLENGYLQ